MPVELTQEQLNDALAVIGERDLQGTQDAQAALGWVGWHGDGPLLLRRHDVQHFVWYVVPRKFLAPLADKRKAIASLGRLLDALGGRAATYADVCRSQDTDELLCAWERDDPAAWGRFCDLLDRSGSEPPDTELLAWGQVMGIDEAGAREQVATALEEAIEDGRLTPGTSGFRRRQAQVCAAALREPAQEGSDVTLLDAVHAERTQAGMPMAGPSVARSWPPSRRSSPPSRRPSMRRSRPQHSSRFAGCWISRRTGSP